MIKPRDEWKKSTLPMALTDQMRMEEVWNSLRTSENYSISNIEQFDESDDDDDDIKIVCISDTHGRHADMDIPAGDVLVHAGDFTMFGLVSEIINFKQWLATLPHKVRFISFLSSSSRFATAQDCCWR